MELYVNKVPGVTYRWQYKIVKEQIVECMINFHHGITRKIVINVYLTTGVFTVDGKGYRKWASQVFPTLKAMTEDDKFNFIDDANSLLQGQIDTEKTVLEKKTDEEALEVEQLWGKNESLENAINNQDSVIQGIINRCQNMEIKINASDLEKVLPEVIIETEKKFDDKLVTFMKTITEDFEKNVKNLKAVFSNKISEMHNKAEEFKTSIQNQVDVLKKEESICKISDQNIEELKVQNNLTKLKFEKIESDWRELDMLNLKHNYEKTKEEVVNVTKLVNEGTLKEVRDSYRDTKLKVDQFEQKVNNVNFDKLKDSDGSVNNKEELKKHKLRIDAIQKQLEEFKNTVESYDQTRHTTNVLSKQQPNTSADQTRNSVEYQSRSVYNKDSLEILMCFDSNGKYIDRKKLWKLNNSDYKRCSTLHNVRELIKELQIKQLKYVMICVGVNDIDNKEHNQIFEEMMSLINEIRTKFPGIKLVISEITPRRDARDAEVKKFNSLLNSFAVNEGDVTVINQSNLRDPTWSMYSDDKHIRENKIAKYASNIIRSLKTAYKINNKNELFTNYDNKRRFQHVQPPSQSNHVFGNTHTGNRWNSSFSNNPSQNLTEKLKSIAEYNTPPNFVNERYDTMSTIKNDLLMQLRSTIENMFTT